MIPIAHHGWKIKFFIAARRGGGEREKQSLKSKRAVGASILSIFVPLMLLVFVIRPDSVNRPMNPFRDELHALCNSLFVVV